VNAYCYRCPLHLTYPSCESGMRQDVENLIQTHERKHRRFIAEPIQEWAASYTAQGIFQDRFQDREEIWRTFYQRRVQTGWGRTGKSGSASSSGK